MKKNSFFFIILCIIIGSLSAHDTQTFNPHTLHNYFWARYNHHAGKLPQASTWYEKLFHKNDTMYSNKWSIKLLAETNNFKKIIELIPSLTNKFSDDPTIQFIFATAFEKTGNIEEARKRYIQLSHSYKDHTEIALQAAQAYIQKKEPENAILTIDAFLNNSTRRPHNFIFYFLKTQIYAQLGKSTDALEAINKCLEMHPQFDKGWLLYAALCEKEGKIKDALAGYATFLELSDGNSEIEKYLAALMLKYKANQANNQILLSHTISLDNALTLFKQHRYPQALTHINSCIQKEPTNTECKILKLQILSAMKDYNQLNSTITAWITDNPESTLWPQSLYLLAHTGAPHAELITIFQSILTKKPNNLWCNIYCADICMRNNMIPQAITCLEHALSDNMDKKLYAKTAYQLALLHYETNNHNAMLTQLENGYTAHPTCPHLNNALAYYWATKGKDLSKAHSFITVSLAADNTNPYFLDTQAVILYKEKKYLQAQQILEPLITHNNGTILLHLAKVHYALNNKKIADTFTQQAHAMSKNDHEKKAVQKMQLLLTET